MKNNIFSGIFLITSLLIGLGAFGHASQWWKHIYPVIGSGIIDQHMLHLLLMVWLFVSACMLCFGIMLVWVWWRIRKGDRNLIFVPVVVGLLYLITGIVSWNYVAPFFALFVVLGGLLLISTWALHPGRTVRRP
jgi:hypothetical protein